MRRCNKDFIAKSAFTVKWNCVVELLTEGNVELSDATNQRLEWVIGVYGNL